MQYEPVIGLEVHAQLLTRSKLFCGCSTLFGAPPNSNTCPVCLALPGALPVINREAVTMAVKAALALGCRLNDVSIFARKNYFYPDLPKGYQISQFDRPLGEHGSVRVFSGDRTEGGKIANRREKAFGITRLHMEDDAGKSIHEGIPESGAKSCVNLNRTGVPLIEIVSEPDFRSSQEAYDYVAQLRKTLIYIGVCDGNMEEGSFRCDANVSIRPVGSTKLGTKVEIKNLNSFRFLQKALDYEIERQKQVVSEGSRIIQETRLWDESSGRTFAMRSKEEAHDYRYFPEPDLVPLKISEWAPAIKETLPELPDARRLRFVEQYGIMDDHAKALTSELKLAIFYEDVAKKADPKMAAVWIVDVLKGELNYRDLTIDAFKKEDILKIIELLAGKKITEDGAVDIIRTVLDKGGTPEEIVKEKGLLKVEGDIVETAALEAIKENPQAVADFKAGKEKALNSLVGAVMKKTKGRADARAAREILMRKLG